MHHGVADQVVDRLTDASGVGHDLGVVARLDDDVDAGPRSQCRLGRGVDQRPDRDRLG